MARVRIPPSDRSSYPRFHTVPTRWMDNDLYGHVNNVVYYSYFDTAVNRYLIEVGGLRIHDGPVIGIAVETRCRFHQSFAYPDDVEVGVSVGHLGRSSVRYDIGLFAAGEAAARADGEFWHVFVSRETMRPVPIEEQMRSALEAIQVNRPDRVSD
ncbi:MAG: thioesterase family protein [Pseudomonadota bacterium]